MSQKLLLKWNNHMNVMDEFKYFLSSGIMIDVTLACDGQSLKAHKIVLSACSSFFKTLFLENPCQHPVVILKDVKYTELKAIIDLMYSGEINVEANQVSSLVKTAQNLKVNGLGEVEIENNHISYESGSPSGDESENLSDIESINESVCTLDVHNGSFEEEQPMIDENDNKHSTSEIVIMETPEIKREEVLSEYKNHSVPSSSALMPFQSRGINASKSMKDIPSLGEQTLTTDSLPRQTFQSTVQSNMELNQNNTDNVPTLLPVTSTDMSPQNHPNDMPCLVSETSLHVPSSQSFQSFAQSNRELNKSHSHNIPSSLSVSTAHLSQGQASTLSNSELNKGHSHNMPGLFSAKPIPLSQGQSFQSSPLSITVKMPGSLSVTSTHQLQRQSLQSNKEMNKSHSHNIPSSLSVTTARLSQGKSFLSSVLSNTELNKSHSHNIPGIFSITPTPVTRGQSFLSSPLSVMELNKNHSYNIPDSLSTTSTCVSQGQSALSNNQLHQSHSDDMHSLLSVTSARVSHGQSSMQSSMKLHQNHSDNIPSSVSVTSTHVLRRLSPQSSKQLHKKNSNNMPKSVSVRSTRVSQRRSPQLNKQLHENNSDNMPNSVSVKSTNVSPQSNKQLHENHSHDICSLLSTTDRQQPSTSSASGRKLKRKIKLKVLPSRKSVCAVQKEVKKNEVYQPPALREPEILIINECHSKKDCHKTKDSKKANNMKKKGRKKLIKSSVK